MNEHPISNLHWYALEPLDVLLFRESKPFSPGDGSWAKGLFPPMPHAVFQALRSTLPTMDKLEESNKLTFIGPFLAHEPPGGELELWFPTPKDLLAVQTIEQNAPNSGDGSTEAEQTEEFEKTTQNWERTVRFQPCPRDEKQWMHIAFPSDLEASQRLAPMVPPVLEINERVSGRLKPWMRTTALVDYLQGKSLSNPTDFTDDPWDIQILPHIQMEPGLRQVKDQEGYFTEVAVRLQPYWKLVAGISTKLEATAVRLGGEGHHVLVEPLIQAPKETPTGGSSGKFSGERHHALVETLAAPKDWKALEPFLTPPSAGTPCSAYVLTPGLAQVGEFLYGVFPKDWHRALEGCVGDRPLLWGGMSVYRKEGKRETAFMPQRAFVVPGTVYRFKEPPSNNHHLLPQRTSAEGWQWVSVFEDLGYGTLLWEKATPSE